MDLALEILILKGLLKCFVIEGALDYRGRDEVAIEILALVRFPGLVT